VFALKDIINIIKMLLDTTNTLLINATILELWGYNAQGLAD